MGEPGAKPGLDHPVNDIRSIILPAATMGLARATLNEDMEVDPLTGLIGRRRLLALMSDRLAQPGATPGLLMIDLDRFKALNDSLGHQIGDMALCRVAQRLRGAAGRDAVLARISGDGFAVMIEDGACAAATAERLIELIARPYAVSGHAFTLGASIGVATAPHDGVDASQLLNAADLALHHAENDGRNRHRRFEPAMQTKAQRRQSLEQDMRAALLVQQTELRRAMALEQFALYYQPQVCLVTGRLVGFEALMRWHHPIRGMIPPDDFIPLAEEIGLIDLLGVWALRTACRQATLWPGLQVGVNVSPIQLRNGPALVQAVVEALAESCLDPECLEIEITESSLMGEVGATLHDLRELGVGLALDDFGTGFSSLSRLGSHPFTRIKIDRSFVAALDDPATARPGTTSPGWMIRAIAALGTGLGMSTIVEGIETLEQAKLAREVGCSQMQGYLISRPVPADALPAMIERLQSHTTQDPLP
jgi:diguanylate cyclase (GGDEF)-like protein